MVKRKGKKKALIAIGHKIIVSAYFILDKKEKYEEPKQREKNKKPEKQAQYFLKKLEEIGFQIDKKHLVPVG